MREQVGILDLSSFAKYEITGQDAGAVLKRVCANRVPGRDGAVALTQMLTPLGGIECEATVTRLGENYYYLLSSAVAELHDLDWLVQHVAENEDVTVSNMTDDVGVLVLCGPDSRDVLSTLTDAELTNEDGFTWMSAREITVSGIPVRALRVSYVGELGWDLPHPIEYQNHVFDRLFEAGENLGLKPFGIRAMDSLRIEKSYRLVGTELSIEYAAFESGLERFVHPNKGNFIGRDALVEWQQRGFNWQFVTVEVHDTTNADALGNNPIFIKGKPVGRATGGNFGFRINKSLALGMVHPEHANIGTELEMDILGTTHKITVVAESPYDPENARLRSQD